MPFEPGQRTGDYEILEILGKGGMGRVYRVRNVISNRTEAMKVLLSDLASEPELGDRFLGEIRTLARLDHPNIAKFHTAFQLENQLVMVMEFVEGVTLAEAARQGPLPLDQTLSYVGQTLSALGYAHRNGVIHRDLKPSNIMITPHAVAKLMDFGIAKSNIDPLVTRPGTTMGSMLYMSPEQVRGSAVDARSDLYSMGVLLYELTAGRRPFEADSTFAILDAQLNAPPRPPVEVNPSLPPALNDIILTAMQKDPALRFSNAEAFRLALESLRQRPSKPDPAAAATIALPSRQAAAPPPPNRPPTPPVPVPAGPGKGSRTLWMTAGAAAVVCVLVAAALTLPHFFKSSASSTPPSAQTSPPSTATSAMSPAAKPADTTSTSAPAPDTGTVAQTPPVSSGPKPTPQVVQQTGPSHPPPVTSTTPPPVTPPAGGGSGTQSATLSSSTANTTPAVAPPTGASQADLDHADEDLMKLRTRADAVRSSLDNLRAQQAASGLGLRQDMASSASRMENYLQASDRALQAKNLDSARKYMDSAEGEIAKLEAFFGR